MDNCVSVMTKILRLYKFTIPIAEPVGITFTTSSLLLSNKYNGAYRVLLGGGAHKCHATFYLDGIGQGYTIWHFTCRAHPPSCYIGIPWS